MSAAERLPDVDGLSVRIVSMRRRHLRAIMRIESNAYPRPWTIGVFSGELADKINRSYIVARVGSTVVGYCGMMITLDEAHITNIAVEETWRRHKIASRLLATQLRVARGRSCRAMSLEVRVSNVGAQQLYQRFGFVPAGVRRRYYENVEDAIVMWANDLETAEFAERLRSVERDIPGLTIVDGVR